MASIDCVARNYPRLPSFREWFPDEVLSPGQMLSLTTVTLLGCQIDQAGQIYDAMAERTLDVGTLLE